MNVADRGGLDTKADMGAFRHKRLIGPVRRALHAVDLIEQVGKLGPRALERRGVDVRDVVRDHFKVGLLGGHARGGDCKCFHRLNPQIAMRLISR